MKIISLLLSLLGFGMFVVSAESPSTRAFIASEKKRLFELYHPQLEYYSNFHVIERNKSEEDRLELAADNAFVQLKHYAECIRDCEKYKPILQEVGVKKQVALHVQSVWQFQVELAFNLAKESNRVFSELLFKEFRVDSAEDHKK